MNGYDIVSVIICACLTLAGDVSSNSWALAKFIRVFITRSHAQSSLLRVPAHLDFCRDKKSPSQARPGALRIVVCESAASARSSGFYLVALGSEELRHGHMVGRVSGCLFEDQNNLFASLKLQR